MRVLVACEFSGRVRDAFRAKGHDAWCCDILPTDADPAWHIQDDVLNVLDRNWDLMIAFPPCTYLSKVGAKWWSQREAEQRQALEFIRLLMNAPIERIAIENPVGKISTAIRKPDQIIQPYWFGEPWRKTTCLWLKNLPHLKATDMVEPTGYWVDADRIRRGRHRDPKMRSLTFSGIANAMAEQWSDDSHTVTERKVA